MKQPMLTLKNKIILSVLLCVLTITGVFIWQSSSILWQQTRSGIYARATSVSEAAAPALQYWLENNIQILESAAHIEQLTQAKETMRHAKESAKYLDVYYATRDGSLYLSGQDAKYPNYDARNAEWYQQALQENRSIVSAPYVSTETQQAMITLATPVKVRGEIIAIMGADISLKSVQDNISGYKVGDNAYAMLLNEQGTIVAHPQTSLEMQPFSAYSSEISLAGIHQAMENNEIQRLSRNGVEKLIYFDKINHTDWILAIEMDRQTEEQSYSELLQKLLLEGVVMTLVLLVIISLFINYLLKDFYQVSHALKAIAQGEGDLTHEIQISSKDEVGQLAQNFNTFVKNMHNMVSQIVALSQQLNQQAQDAAQQAQHRSQRIATQQDEINMVATAVTEMSTATHEIALNAENTSKEGEATVDVSRQGVSEVQRSQQSILALASDVERSAAELQELEHHVHSISNILSVISEIAEQTNLLALNAAIEAARAGEQGRGFAVVADEVRILSQRTHTSTSEIQKTIETLQSATHKVVNTMTASHANAQQSVSDAETACQSLENIMASVQRINDMSTQIATAAEEQSLVTEEITRNTQAVNDVSNELAQAAVTATEQAKKLSDYSKQLHQLVSQFKL
ncbi:methyl-accepting chemotaxis protein [Vibrio vulnificus]|uniref:methyl-accepting chemotaxis protein n=1 Tax=Vibrio vulnificus TaxID=672 RepID=UPI0040593EB0